MPSVYCNLSYFVESLSRLSAFFRHYLKKKSPLIFNFLKAEVNVSVRAKDTRKVEVNSNIDVLNQLFLEEVISLLSTENFIVLGQDRHDIFQIYTQL